MAAPPRPALGLWLCLLLPGLPALAQEGGPPAPSSAPTGLAPEAAEVFVRANAAYEGGDFEAAVQLYQELLARGVDSGQVHYNLGNAYLRSGQLGRAVAAYRRSQSRLPRDQDVAANLAFARKSARDALAPPEPSAVLRTLFFWHFGLSRGELAAAVLVLNLGFWGVLALRLVWRRAEVLRWSAAVLLLPLLATAGSLALGAAFPRRIAVVLPQEIDAHSGTSADTVVRFKLHAGSEVRVVEEREGWLRIALPDGQQGWIDRQFAELVRL